MLSQKPTKYGVSLRITDDPVTHLNTYENGTNHPCLRVVSINENPLGLPLVSESTKYPLVDVTSAEIAKVLVSLVIDTEPNYNKVLDYAQKENLILRKDLDRDTITLSLIKPSYSVDAGREVAMGSGATEEEAACRLLRVLGTKCSSCYRFYKTELRLSPGIAQRLGFSGPTCPTCIGLKLAELDEFANLDLKES